MRLAIVGSRDFTDYKRLKSWASILIRGVNPLEVIIISGGARGADSLARKFANLWDFPFEEYAAHWDELGKSAGFARNKEMAEEADIVLAFWDGKSPGTKHMIDASIKLSKPTIIVPS
ncbi:hypothetical protein LCGC14_0475630 [marine sediment metagenome]|uniref:YspA cpYpsA-related SLOG domain-containing protein n=1 Tax=marine sediment metagenome TaxID=412755 RepID=A0A0F9SB15_9ZZZZ